MKTLTITDAKNDLSRWLDAADRGQSICSGGRGRDRIETACSKFKDRVNLLPRDVEQVGDFFDAGSGFKVFEYGGHGHPGMVENPCAAKFPNTHSAAGHWDPSRAVIFLRPFHRRLFLPHFGVVTRGMRPGKISRGTR